MNAPAKRPPTRQRTRSTEANRDAAHDQGVRLTIDGRVYEVRHGDLSALDVRALRREVGVSFVGLIDELNDAPDVDSIAAFMWLARRLEGEKALTYEAVAAEVDYDITDSLKIDEPGAEDATTDPEG